MYNGKREISKEMYDRAQVNKGYLTGADCKEIFSIQELCGYGIYGAQVTKDETDGKYYVVYSRGSSCD